MRLIVAHVVETVGVPVWEGEELVVFWRLAWSHVRKEAEGVVVVHGAGGCRFDNSWAGFC